MSYELGKYAALEDAIDLLGSGAGLSDVLEVIDGTLSAPMDKNASYGEDEYRLGVDGMCYEILKVAHDLYGNYDTSGYGDDDLLEIVLEKVAEDAAESAGPGFFSRNFERGKQKAKDLGGVIGRNKGKSALGATALLAAAGGGRHLYKKRKARRLAEMAEQGD